MKRLFFLLVALFLFLPGLGYLLSLRLDTAVFPASAAFVAPEGGAEVGKIGGLEFELTLPLHCKVGAITAELGDAMVLSGTPETHLVRYFFDRARYRVTLRCSLLAPGMTPEGKLTVGIAPALKNSPGTIRVAPLEIAKAVPASALILADALAVKPASSTAAVYYYCGIGALFLALAFAAYFHYRRGGAAAEALPSLQEKTLFELARLRLDLERRRFPAVTAFVRLTDLVRGYLERRFDIPASRRTTDEFFTSLSGRGNPVPDTEKPFLREFLNAADLVKFAKAEPDEGMLGDALDRAEKLVARTTPEKEVRK